VLKTENQLGSKQFPHYITFPNLDREWRTTDVLLEFAK